MKVGQALSSGSLLLAVLASGTTPVLAATEKTEENKIVCKNNKIYKICSSKPKLATGTIPQKAETVQVVARQQNASVSAEKMSIPFLENPQVISVVSRKIMDQQNVLRLNEALRNVAGVSYSDNYALYDSIRVRGMSTSGMTYLDGLKTIDNLTMNETVGLSRLEVVKGPASGLFGQGPLSGLVNMVSKRPEARNFASLTAQGGSWSYYEGRADINRDVLGNGLILARLNTLYRKQDYFVRDTDMETVYIAPSISIRPTAHTDFTMLFRYNRTSGHPYSAIPAYGTVLPSPFGRLSRRFSINDEENPAQQRQTDVQLGYLLDHRFNDIIGIHQGLRYMVYHQSYNRWLFASDDFSDDLSQVGRYYYGPYNNHGTDLRIDTNVNLRFHTGKIFSHYVLAGVDYGQNATNSTSGFTTTTPLSLVEPIYGNVANFAGSSIIYKARQDQFGIYLQDHLKIGHRLAVTFGMRWDRATAERGGNNPPTTAFSPHAGFTYGITDQFAFYFNWSRAFLPTTSVNYRQEVLPPQRGTDYEFGLKAQTKDGRVHGMATLFELARTNVPTTDPAHPLYSISQGEQTSKGFELEASWAIFPNWSATMAYTYLDTKITKDNDLLPNGGSLWLASVPHHIFNIWTKYSIPSGGLKGLGLGGGVHVEGASPADNYTPRDPVYGLTYKTSAYALINLALYYERGPWNAQINIQNVGDKRYFPAASLSRTTVGTPRTVIAGVTRNF
ncbi:MAG: TonB-dependent siderophore receptor [Gluconacetobacter sp.]|uniref:TonB-dependent siderophore receptor n=1 Tax=Gluconacetobacter dulcium TaxID=2729096 RepID=A0A7W4JYE1_9PROT|nr:TonB-dependent siderophore receptor [Gluconacetobacter dulcium]MBB2196892.1 TonB-dependent siderophore receptor [Gluconacetobacter dulcium]